MFLILKGSLHGLYSVLQNSLFFFRVLVLSTELVAILVLRDCQYEYALKQTYCLLFMGGLEKRNVLFLAPETCHNYQGAYVTLKQ